MNELIIRLAVISVCLILIAAAAAFIVIIAGEKDSGYAEVPVYTAEMTDTEIPAELTETTAEETMYSVKEADITDAPVVTTVPPETAADGETVTSRTIITSRARKE